MLFVRYLDAIVQQFLFRVESRFSKSLELRLPSTHHLGTMAYNEYISISGKYEKNPFSSYQMFTQANIEKAKADLGFDPEYDIRSGVREMLDQ